MDASHQLRPQARARGVVGGCLRAAALAMTFGEHLAASVRGLACAPPRQH